MKSKLGSLPAQQQNEKPSSYPRVPRPAMGGLGGFCVGGFVLDNVPVLAG